MKQLLTEWKQYVETLIDQRQRLTETTLKRVMEKYFDVGFVSISADRDCDSEKGFPCTPEEQMVQAKENKENEKRIRQDINAAGFGYIPTFGGFRERVVDPETGEETLKDNPEPEASFTIPAVRRNGEEGPQVIEALHAFARKACEDYNQDSYLFKPPQAEDPNAYFLTRTGEIDGDDGTFTDVVANDLEQIYFTKLRKKKGVATYGDRFSFLPENFSLYIPHVPKTVREARRRRGEIFIRIGK